MSLKQEANRICNDLENPSGAGYVVIFKDIPFYNPETKKTEMRCYIEKHIDNLSKPCNIARQEHLDQYPKQYAAYLEMKRIKGSGTSLQLLPDVNPADIENCERHRVYTIETLAEVADDVIVLIGNVELRDKAVAYLKGQTSKDLEIEKLKEELEKAKNVSSNNDSGHSARDATVRKSNKRNRKQQQGNAASTQLFKGR